mgnify:CR=1 FL=1|jgi:hypothetical protein
MFRNFAWLLVSCLVNMLVAAIYLADRLNHCCFPHHQGLIRGGM